MGNFEEIKKEIIARAKEAIIKGSATVNKVCGNATVNEVCGNAYISIYGNITSINIRENAVVRGLATGRIFTRAEVEKII